MLEMIIIMILISLILMAVFLHVKLVGGLLNHPKPNNRVNVQMWRFLLKLIHVLQTAPEDFFEEDGYVYFDMSREYVNQVTNKS